MSAAATHPTTAECPDARDCPHDEPLHYHHGGCPACYQDFRAQHSQEEEAKKKAENDKTNAGNAAAITCAITATGNARDDEDSADDDLAAEVFAMRLGEQIIDPSDLTALEIEYGLRPGARELYPDGREWTEPGEEKVADLVARYREGKIPLNDFVYCLSGVAWGVCEWGSCQYATALAMFRTLSLLKRAGYDPTAILGWGASATLTANAIGIATAAARIADGLATVVHERAEEDGEEPDPIVLARAESLRDLPTLDAAFQAMRDLSWDLWSAAGHTSHMVFATEFADVEALVGASPGIGPSANILAQSDNYTTALRCYLLVAGGYVADPSTAFADFDT